MGTDLTELQDLLDIFPVSEDNITKTCSRYVGQKVSPNNVYKTPTPEIKLAYQTLLKTLQRYENHPNKINLNKIQLLLTELDMNGYTFKKNPDTIFLYPKDLGKMGATILWRLGDTKIPGQPETYNNPVNRLFISQEHAGTDFTEDAATEFFNLSAAKCMITNTMVRGASRQTGDCSSFISDFSHSNSTIAVPIFQTLLQEMYPDATLINLHSMRQMDITKLLLVNNYNNKFLKNGEKSFALLFAIACAGIEDLPLKSIQIGSDLPGYITRNGKQIKLTIKTSPNDALFSLNSSPHSNNVIGHVANYGVCDLGRKQLDRSVHIELGRGMNGYNARISPQRTKLIEALTKAMDWYLKYDPALHDPWKLEETNPEIFYNMQRYGELFDNIELNPKTEPLLFSQVEIATTTTSQEETKITFNNKPCPCNH